MKKLLETALTAVLALCAIVITGLLVRREFSPPPSDARIERKPILVANWRTHQAAGERIGPAAAPMQVIEFGDYQCPYCASFHRDFKVLRDRFPTNIALTYVHYPLPSHQFAEPAARAAECARAQGRFEAIHDQLFESQSTIGVKPFEVMASEVGVPDLAAFEACMKSNESISRIVQGKLLADELDVRGTPTIIINGWMLARTPTATELESMMKAVLGGKSPVAPRS